MAEVSKAVGEAAKITSENQKFLKSFRFNIKGDITEADEEEDMALTGEDERNINYLNHEDFESLD